MKLKLPSWLKRDELLLPPWAEVGKSPRVEAGKVSVILEADTDGYVAEWFALLDVKTPDQYWLEVAYQCAKMDLQMAISGTQYDPLVSGKPAEFHFKRSERWALKNFQPGRGVQAASRDKEARVHYLRIRGKLPM
jgi:hypothetical protein